MIKRMSDEFIERLERLARERHILVICFEKGQGTGDVAREYLARFVACFS